MPKDNIVILTAPYYEDIVGSLRQGVDLSATGYRKVTVSTDIISVAGALELPLALSFIAQGYKPDIEHGRLGVVVLGCVIRGETDHFSLICREVFSGLQRVALEHSLPLGVGVLACYSKEQAEERAEQTGFQAFVACHDLLILRQRYLARV